MLDIIYYKLLWNEAILKIVNALSEKEKMSGYRLSKESGVPMTTITDICSGKAYPERHICLT